MGARAVPSAAAYDRGPLRLLLWGQHVGTTPARHSRCSCNVVGPQAPLLTLAGPSHLPHHRCAGSRLASLSFARPFSTPRCCGLYTRVSRQHRKRSHPRSYVMSAGNPPTGVQLRRYSSSEHVDHVMKDHRTGYGVGGSRGANPRVLWARREELISGPCSDRYISVSFKLV